MLQSSYVTDVPCWTADQVLQWLQSIGLPQYIPNFREQKVDGSQLLQLDSVLIKVVNISLIFIFVSMGLKTKIVFVNKLVTAVMPVQISFTIV